MSAKPEPDRLFDSPCCSSASDYRQIDGFPNCYVDDDGCVFSKSGSKYLLLRYYINKDGYRRLALSYNCKRQSKFIHVLVLESFVGKRPKNKETRHLNGISEDNRLSNLCWGTKRQNSDDQKRHRKRYKRLLEKVNVFQARIIRRCSFIDRLFLAELFNVRPAIITRIRKNDWPDLPEDNLPAKCLTLMQEVPVNINFVQYRILAKAPKKSAPLLAKAFGITDRTVYSVRSGSSSYDGRGWTNHTLGSLVRKRWNL